MESYGNRFKRLFGRALIIAALVVFFWVWWTATSADRMRESRGVVLGDYYQRLDEAYRGE